MRTMLLCFVVLVTLITLSSGVLLIYEPDGALLELSPVLPPNALFNNYLVPGLLLTIIGIANFMGLILINRRHQLSYRFSLLGGAVLIIGIALQIILFPYYHWLQVIGVAIGLLVVLLSYQLMGKAAF